MTMTEDRFWSKADRLTEGCWSWRASRDQYGYGRFNIDQVIHKAHRVAWEKAYGPIPVGKCVCHRCDNPSCVRPDHLFLASQAENIVDCNAKGRATGGRMDGELNPSSKLTVAQVLDICRDRFERAATLQAIANHYGVTLQAIHLIVSGKKWRSVTGGLLPARSAL